MSVLIWLIVFLFGLCVGSFLNVVVYRLNHGLSPFQGRSFCPKCRKKILWYDNLPLISFVFLKGKCRFCHSPISFQYPLVELFTSILFVITSFLLINKTGGLLIINFELWIKLFYYLFITASLIAIFVSDLRYQTVLDEVVLFGIIIAFLYSFFEGSLISILSGLGAGLFFLSLVLITRGKGMGMGDVKLAVLMGLILGFPKIIIALIIAFLTGALVGVILVLVNKKHFKEPIPFGPFLTGATWISLFWGQKIWQLYIEKFFF